MESTRNIVRHTLYAGSALIWGLLLGACASTPVTPTGTPRAAVVAAPPDLPTVVYSPGKPPAPQHTKERPAPERPAAQKAAPPKPSPPAAQPLPALASVELPVASTPAAIDLTEPADDLWLRIRQGFAIPNLDSPLVQDKVALYASQPEYLGRMFERSRLYLYHIVAELERRSMPMELALLPMVESAFNPMAYSRAHASGLWQFIPPTGKRYSLKQTWWFDARRDIVDSTNAALGYLADLYEMHGDWQLALASYNWGENAVGRAVERNRSAGLATDYTALAMPPETRQYIPKLQALKNIIMDPGRFGITLEPIPNEPYFATITKTRDIDVHLAAKLAEMPVEEFVALNPGYSRPFIPVNVNPRLVLPADRVELFHANLLKYDDKTLVSWKTYRPLKGETVDSIAKKFRVPLAKLKEVNGITPRTRGIPPLLVVPADPSAASQARLPLMYAPPVLAPLKRGVIHLVRQGETLYSIAKRYRTSVANIERWNGLKGQIFAGQRLQVGIRSVKRTRRAASP